MKNPRAIYSRGIWQGGGATVLKPYDASGVFGKVLAQKAAQRKQKTTSVDDFVKFIDIKKNYDYKQEDFIKEKRDEFVANATKKGQEVGWDWSTPEGQQKWIEIGRDKNELENIYNATVENRRVYDNFLKDVLSTNKEKDGGLYDIQKQDILKKATDIYSIQNPLEQRNEWIKFTQDADLTRVRDDMKLYGDIANKYLKYDQTSQAYMLPGGNTFKSTDRFVTQDKVDVLNNAIKQDAELNKQWDLAWKYSPNIDKTQYNNDINEYKKQRADALGKNFIWERTGKSVSGLSSGGAADQEIIKTVLTPQYTKKSYALNGNTQETNVYGADWDKYNKGKVDDLSIGNLIGEETAIDSKNQSKLDPTRQYRIRYSGPEIMPVLRVDAYGMKKGLITKEIADYIKTQIQNDPNITDKDAEWNKIMGSTPIIRRYVIDKDAYDKIVSGGDNSKLETFVRDNAIETYYPYTEGRKGTVDQNVKKMTYKQGEQPIFPTEYIERMWKDYHYSELGLNDNNRKGGTTTTTKITFAEWQKKNPKGTYADYKKQNK